MRKVIGITLIVILLLTAMAVPAVARRGRGGGGGGGKGGRGGQGRGGTVFALAGKVVAVSWVKENEDVPETITVEVEAGNRLVREYIGTNVTILTTEETRFRNCEDSPGVLIRFEDVEVGDFVSVGGTVDANTEQFVEDFVAERVTVGASLQCLD